MRARQFNTTSTAAAVAAREEKVLIDGNQMESLVKGPSASTVLREAYSLFDSFLKQNSPYEVNVSAMIRKRVEAQLQSMSKAVNALIANQYSSSAIKAVLPPPPPHIAISFGNGNNGTGSVKAKSPFGTSRQVANRKPGSIILPEETEHFVLESIRSVFDEAVIGM
jgi:hypothetical protein